MGEANAGGRICLGCRVTVLSRYNPDLLCGACARESRTSVGIVPCVPGWLWDSGPIRAALARVDLAVFVTALRGGWQLTQTELAELVPGWSQGLVSMIERGLRDTLYDIRKLLVFVDTIGMPRAALAPLLLGDPDATLEGGTAVALQEADIVDIGRREFGALTAGLVAAAILPTPERVDQGHVRYLQAALTQLRAQDDAVGGGGVLPEALRHFEYARRMLDESDYSTAVGRELLLVTADLGIDTAWLAFDADNQPLARRIYEQAALLADSAGDGAQRAYLYANMVQQSTYLARHTGRKGFAREALRFADRAHDAARHEPSPMLHTLISYRQALAYAQLDDEVAFRSAITTARRELDRGPHEADSARTKFVCHSEITSHEAAGRLRLGAPAHAVRLYHSALGDTARSPRDQAVCRARLAGTLVVAGDLEQAISHGLTILPDLGTTLTSGRVLQALSPVRDAAGTAAITEFCDRFDAAAHALRLA